MSVIPNMLCYRLDGSVLNEHTLLLLWMCRLMSLQGEMRREAPLQSHGRVVEVSFGLACVSPGAVAPDELSISGQRDPWQRPLGRSATHPSLMVPLTQDKDVRAHCFLLLGPVPHP